MNKLRADNCTAVTAFLDPPGPPVSGLLPPIKKPEEVPEEPPTSPKSPELTALLSAPVVGAPASVLETSLPVDMTAPECPSPLRVLRNRSQTTGSIENKCLSARKPAPSSSGLRKRVTLDTSSCTERKRPATRSRHDSASEERNASDTENQGSTPKKSRQSLPSMSSSANHRILRSSTPQVRSLRSQDSIRMEKSPIHMKRKRSRSFTPVKRRK